MRKICKILVVLLSIMLISSAFALNAFASEKTENGMKVEIITDKEDYQANEDIHVTVKVTNTNEYAVTNVSIESLLPEGMTLKQDKNLAAAIEELGADEELELSFVAVVKKELESSAESSSNGENENSSQKPDTSSQNSESSKNTVSSEKPTIVNTVNNNNSQNGGKNGNSPSTGDNTPIVLLIVTAVLSLLALTGAIIMKKKKFTKIGMVVFGLLLSAQIFNVVMIRAVADENNNQLDISPSLIEANENVDETNLYQISVSKSINVLGENYDIEVNVKYEVNYSDSEFVPSRDADVYINDNLYSDYSGVGHLVKDQKSGLFYFNNQLTIFFGEYDSEKGMEHLKNDLQVTIVGKNIHMNSCLIKFEDSYLRKELENIAETLEQKEYVKYAHLNFCIEEKFQVEPKINSYPDDARWVNLWGEIPEGLNWGMEAIYAPSIWQQYEKAMDTINIGIYDGGADTSHFDLKDVLSTVNTGNETKNSIDHGTHVAGIIGAEYNNEVGITGVFPKAKMQLLSKSLSSAEIRELISEDISSTDVNNLAYVYLASEKKSRVINVSMGYGDSAWVFAASKGNVVAQAEIRERAERLEKALLEIKEDFLICVSAGNPIRIIENVEAEYGYYKIVQEDGEQGYYDNNNEWVPYSGAVISETYNAEWGYNLNNIDSLELKNRIIVVGAVCLDDNSKYQIASSSYASGNRIDILAPGVDIDSTISDNSFETMSGTSMASPHVAGLAGILFSLNPELKSSEVKKIIVETATTEVGNANGKKMINAKQAVDKLSLRGKISGKVIDEEGNPIEQAVVSVGLSMVKTNDKGEFTISTKVGTQTFSVEKENYKKYFGIEIVKHNWETLVLKDIVLEKGTGISFAGGDGSEEKPYQVATAEQLNYVRNNLSAYYIQVSDIDLSGYNSWKPIGHDYDNIFQGSYNGQGYSIKNMSIKNISEYVGLFGRVSPPYDQDTEFKELKNIHLKNVQIDITSNSQPSFHPMVGSIAGAADNITNCHAEGIIKLKNPNGGGSDIGGINGAGNASNCSSRININMTSSEGSSKVGGIVGFGHVNKSVNYGDITTIIGGDSFIDVGGIIGYGNSEKCVNYGNIYGETTEYKSYSSSSGHYNCNVGGIVGDPGEISDCINYGSVTAIARGVGGIGDGTSGAGGIAGYGGAWGSGKIRNCYNLSSGIFSTHEMKEDNDPEKIITVSSNAGRIFPEGWGIRESVDLYSIDSTLVNGEIPTDFISSNDSNGRSLTREDIEKAIEYILSELNLPHKTMYKTSVNLKLFSSNEASEESISEDTTDTKLSENSNVDTEKKNKTVSIPEVSTEPSPEIEQGSSEEEQNSVIDDKQSSISIPESSNEESSPISESSNIGDESENVTSLPIEE
jgi:Subtilisin-like serine proteases